MGSKLSYPEVDLSEKVVLITGGNTGIGYETAKGLARLGAHTFIACRSKERAENAIERIKRELSPTPMGSAGGSSSSGVSATTKSQEENQGSSTDNPGDAADGEEVRSKDEGKQEGGQQAATRGKEIKLEYIPLDLASFQSTKECVRIFKERGLPLHILINNAAIGGIPYTTTGDSLEAQFQVNHLSPMLLTLELFPILLDTASSSGDVRILFVSSIGHFFANSFNPNKLNLKEEEQTGRMKLYSNSKLYNVMTGYCMQRRLQNKSITVSSLHPGYVKTELVRGVQDRKILMAVHNVAVNLAGRNPVEGAATSVNCAVNPKLNSQQHFYYDSCKIKVSSADSRNEQFQEQLWEKSIEFLKDHLSPDILEQYGQSLQKKQVASSENNEVPSATTPSDSEQEKTSSEDNNKDLPNDKEESPEDSSVRNEDPPEGGSTLLEQNAVVDSEADKKDDDGKSNLPEQVDQ